MDTRFAIVLGAAAIVTVAAFADRDRESVAQAPGRWVSIGDGPFALQSNPNVRQSGRVSSIAVDPRDDQHWLLGVGNGGVWETRDAGGSFVPIIDNTPTLAVGAVTFAPSDPDVIYVGTGEAAGVGFTHTGVGILKSVNGGRTWALLGESFFGRASIRRVRVAPHDAGVVIVASARGGFGRDAGEPMPVAPPYGILKSTNAGVGWSRTLAGQATALEVDPSNFSRQYAAIGDQRVGTFVDDRNAAQNGIYRSTNGGDTWSLIEGPWGREPSSTRSAVGRIELAIAPSNPDVVYASIQIPPNGGSSATGLLGLFRTDNAWANPPTWIQIPTDASGPGGYCGPGKCGYSHVLSVDPREANTLFAGGAEQGFWRCTNCGSSPTWTNTTRNVSVHPDHHAVEWAGNRLIDGNDGGVWSSVDLGATWQNHNRVLPTTMFYAGALHPTDPSFILGGPRDFALAVFRANGGWQILQQARTSEWGEGEVAVSSSRPDTDWMATWLYGVIQRTTDGGRTSQQVDGGIDRSGAAFVAPTRKCPTNDDVFVMGTNRLWRTNDFFSSSTPRWTGNSPPDTHPFPNSLTAPGTILSIAYVESDRGCNTYAYGNRGGEVRLTRNGGASWTDLDPGRGLPGRPVSSLVFDPANPNRLFAAVSSFDEATPSKPGHIFRTENALSASPSWTLIGPPDVPFANMPFNVVAIDPRDTRLVYAGSDNGLWMSSDGGNGWTKIGLESSLPPAPVYDIQINPTTNRTVVFTYGRGAFELVR